MDTEKQLQALYILSPSSKINFRYYNINNNMSTHRTRTGCILLQQCRIVDSSHLSLRLILRKVETDAIYAMPLIRRCGISFSLKNMPQMTPAIVAHDLCPFHPERIIHEPLHCTGNGVKISGPTASGLELVRCLVQRCVTGGAGIYALGRIVRVVFARIRRLGALLAKNSELFCITASQ